MHFGIVGIGTRAWSQETGQRYQFAQARSRPGKAAALHESRTFVTTRPLPIAADATAGSRQVLSCPEASRTLLFL